MTLSDPTRPLIGDRPAFASGMSIIPSLGITPLSHDMCRVECMLPVAPGEFTWHKCILVTSLLPRELETFRNDPEAWFQARMAWAGPVRPASGSNKLTLEDFLS